MKVHFILFVEDQQASTRFYSDVFDADPSLNVPGMTEFEIGGAVLGLMPASGARRLLGSAVDIKTPAGISAAETYIIVDDAERYHSRAIAAGAREISPLSKRDWGHSAAYCAGPDGHILAFAEINED